MTPPAPEYAANAPRRKKSAPDGMNAKRRVSMSKPTSPAPAASQVCPGTKSSASARNPPRMQTIRTQLRISRVRSIRRPTSRTQTVSEEGADADKVDGVAILGRGESAGEEIEDRARGGAGPRRPAGLEEVENRVDPGPEGRAGPRAHEARERRLAGGQRIAHGLHVEHRLKKDGDGRHPEERQSVSDERGRPEQKLAAADREPEDDDAGADDADPGEPLRHRRGREVGAGPRVEARAGFRRGRRGVHWRSDCGFAHQHAGAPARTGEHAALGGWTQQARRARWRECERRAHALDLGLSLPAPASHPHPKPRSARWPSGAVVPRPAP